MTDKCVSKNIARIMREKRIKLETVSKETAISKGELSKIINGQRKDFRKHLDIIAKVLGVEVAELEKPITETPAEKKESKLTDKTPNIETLYERLIKANKTEINMQRGLIGDLKQDLAFWKKEVELLKEQIKRLENRL